MGPADALVTFSHPYHAYLFYLVVSWWLAWGAYWLVAAQRDLDWPWHRVLGVALVLWPFVRYANLIFESFGNVLDPTSVAGTVPADVWWESIQRRFWQYVLVPGVGMYLALGYAQGQRGVGVRVGVAASVKDTLVRLDCWTRRGWMRTLVHGLGLFVIVFFGYLLLAYLLSPLRRFDTGEESAVFDALTPSLAIVLALTAGITEEFLFRGVLQTRLQRAMPVWAAIGVQAVFFGLIHSGYGTLGHIIMPIFFGIAMGVLALYVGVVPLIIVHALVDLVIFFGTTASLGYAWTGHASAVVLAVSVIVPGTYYTVRLWQRLRRRGAPEPADMRAGPEARATTDLGPGDGPGADVPDGRDTERDPTTSST